MAVVKKQAIRDYHDVILEPGDDHGCRHCDKQMETLEDRRYFCPRCGHEEIVP